MKLNRCILDNKGLSYFIDKKFQSSLITRKLYRLEQYFPDRIRELKDSLSDISMDTVEALENNIPVRYVSQGVYINEIDTCQINHNIEDINEYLKPIIDSHTLDTAVSISDVYKLYGYE